MKAKGRDDIFAFSAPIKQIHVFEPVTRLVDMAKSRSGRRSGPKRFVTML